MKSIESKTSRFLDIIFCVAFMPLLILLGPAHHWMKEWPVFFAIECVYLYGCYFAIRYVRVPLLFINRQYSRIAVLALILTACNCALTFYPHPEMDFVIPSMSEYQTSVRNYSVSLSLWLMFFAVMCYSITISFITELYHQMLLRKDVENQRNKAELAIFKAQISPHFLFNTLNSLYSLVIGTSTKAENAFIKFTELLKYTYVTIENESVPLRDEISYIQNYIDLQGIRLNEHTRIEWHHDVDDAGKHVPPMIFLTFVENAFKYGASTSRDCTVSISLTLRDGLLEFRTRNTIMKHSDKFRTEVPVGISNCRGRLDGLFPGKYTLDTEESNGIFNLNLKIRLN